MNRLSILALPCLLDSAAPQARANEWLRATTAIDNQSKRTWTLEGRDLPATFIVATAGNGREETVAYTDTLTHAIPDGQEIRLRLADPTRTVEAWFTVLSDLRKHVQTCSKLTSRFLDPGFTAALGRRPEPESPRA